MKEKIGIWGLGLVGKSVLSYLSNKNYNIEVLENRDLNALEIDFLKQNNSYLRESKDIENFFQDNNYIIPSPGIDLSNYSKYNYKLISELDLFNDALNNSPIKTIAITGTLGKTSVAHLLNKVLTELNFKTLLGGNIGIPMLNLLNNTQNKNLIILELSSFQLEFNKKFAPDLAIITNFYSNHLDRHKTLENYFNAKLNILKKQSNQQKALIPISFANRIKQNNISSQLYYFSSTKPTNFQLSNINSSEIVYFIKNNTIFKLDNKIETKIISINKLFKISYPENWLIIVATCDIFNISINKLINIKNLDIPDHRMELVAKYNNIYFYNDSKSTLPEATLAAVKTLKNKPIVLFLGGLSKGVDRTELLKKLKNKVTRIICFGQEAKLLQQLCNLNNINSNSFNTLEEAFFYCTNIVNSGDYVLFSPSGSSFDLFKDYQDRGNKFKQLVKEYINKSV